ncbi:hypothetical protein TWF694_011198 [Orbilia ellipsospora]|uniref:C2H2-type domain-containing protein n=1 Tax=Orbilia ellipsospora TaxID=2528407 RepID=A0AAV9X8U1_9PEZI
MAVDYFSRSEQPNLYSRMFVMQYEDPRFPKPSALDPLARGLLLFLSDGCLRNCFSIPFEHHVRYHPNEPSPKPLEKDILLGSVPSKRDVDLSLVYRMRSLSRIFNLSLRFRKKDPFSLTCLPCSQEGFWQRVEVVPTEQVPEKKDDKRYAKKLFQWIYLVILIMIRQIVYLPFFYYAIYHEWPDDGQRMPVCVWPCSLSIPVIVLWGVCWMFGVIDTVDFDDLCNFSFLYEIPSSVSSSLYCPSLEGSSTRSETIAPQKRLVSPSESVNTEENISGQIVANIEYDWSANLYNDLPFDAELDASFGQSNNLDSIGLDILSFHPSQEKISVPFAAEELAASAVLPAGPNSLGQNFAESPRLAIGNSLAVENGNGNEILSPTQDSAAALLPGPIVPAPKSPEIQQILLVPTEKNGSKRQPPKPAAGKKRKLNQCPQCTFESSNQRAFGEHMSKSHGVQSFKCEHCKTSIARYDNVKGHQQTCKVRLKKVHEVAKFERKRRDEANGGKRPRVSVLDLPDPSLCTATIETPSASAVTAVGGMPEQPTEVGSSKAYETSSIVPERASESPSIESSGAQSPQQGYQLDKRPDEMTARIAALEKENANLKEKQEILQTKVRDLEDELEDTRAVWREACKRLRQEKSKRRAREEELS